jgi:hypothetical protein
MTDLSTWTPRQVDEALSDIYDRLSPLAQRLESATKSAKHIGEQLRTNPRTYYGQDDFDRALAAKDAAAAAYREVEAETAPYDAEFKRRGGWTRAWLCLAAGGHVHNTMACSTCFWNTRFGWLPELSGHDEAEIVEAAGSDACTVCYPTAPVIAKPRSIFHHTEQTAQAARDQRATEKAEREAKKAAKAIANPDGSPLRVYSWHTPERQVVDRDGTVIKVIEAHDNFDTLETLHAAKAWLTDSQESWGRTPRPQDIAAVAEAVARKLGTTAADEIAAAAKRAAKRK